MGLSLVVIVKPSPFSPLTNVTDTLCIEPEVGFDLALGLTGNSKLVIARSLLPTEIEKILHGDFILINREILFLLYLGFICLLKILGIKFILVIYDETYIDYRFLATFDSKHTFG